MFNHYHLMIYAGGHLTILESVDSTNNYAMARVRTGLAKHGDAFFAMAQYKGKGQRGKNWITESGTNIIITLVMKPKGLVMQQQFLFSAVVSLAVHDFFSAYAGDETCVKWPNDIYWRDRKAGGILIESIVGSRESGVNTQEERLAAPDSQPLANSWRWAIVGMGININQTVFPEEIRDAVSLKQITGRDWDVIQLAKELCEHVMKRYEQVQGESDWLQEYNNRLYKKNQPVKFRKGNRVFEARVKEVNSLGELVLDTGIEEHFGFGEIEWIL
jgi:BirA family biotin operon repressor/biotin-[acetyl-CoA-carboxylase] ligase